MTAEESPDATARRNEGPPPPEFRAWIETGDPRASEWLDRHRRPMLLRFCRGYLGDRDAAEDVAQETLVRALSRREAPDNLRAWLFTIARNLCHNRLRGAGRDPVKAALLEDDQFVASMTGPLTGVLRAERIRRLRETLEQLTPLQEETLRLRHLEGLSREEIAQLQESSVDTVKTRLFEAMKALRRLADSELDSR